MSFTYTSSPPAESYTTAILLTIPTTFGQAACSHARSSLFICIYLCHTQAQRERAACAIRQVGGATAGVGSAGQAKVQATEDEAEEEDME